MYGNDFKMKTKNYCYTTPHIFISFKTHHAEKRTFNKVLHIQYAYIHNISDIN